MTQQKVGWGIIGASSWAKNTFAPAITAAGNAELCAVLSSEQRKADALCEAAGMGKGYADLEAFLSDPGVEAVWIASPNYLHAPQAIAALNHGKHVLCEKPMAITAAECRSMIDAAEKAGRLLSVGYHMRYNPLHQELQAEWAAGKYGKPICVRAQLYFAYKRPAAEWRRKKAMCGGWALGDVGTHLIDLLRWFLGDAAQVRGELSNLKFGYETEDHALVTVRFKNGALGVADASTGAGAPAPRLELYGSESYCICEGTLFGIGGKVARGKLSQAPEVTNGPLVNLYQLETEAFGRAIREGANLLVTAQDGLENIRIIEQARGW
jgi:1,5-anhydro-D-fructose reductase (1,5-anhydro-D-mannitol-forming)